MGCDILEEWGGRDLPPLRRPWPPQRPRRQGVPRASLRPRRSLGRRRRACARAPRARGAPQRRRGARRRRSRRARVARRARYTRRVSGRSRSPPRARDGAAHSTRGRSREESDHPNDSDPPLPRWGTADGGGASWRRCCVSRATSAPFLPSAGSPIRVSSERSLTTLILLGLSSEDGPSSSSPALSSLTAPPLRVSARSSPCPSPCPSRKSASKRS